MLKLMNHASKLAGNVSSKVIGYPLPKLHPSKQELKLTSFLSTRHSLHSGPTSCAHCLWLVPLQLALQAMHVDLVSCSGAVLSFLHSIKCYALATRALQDQTLAQHSESAASQSMNVWVLVRRLLSSSRNMHLDLPTTVHAFCEKQVV